MIFSNLLYLIVVILALGAGDVPKSPDLPPVIFFSVIVLKGLGFRFFTAYYLSRKRVSGPGGYFQAEKSLAALAVLFFLADVYLLGLKYYLGLFPLANQLPSLISLAGLGWFYLYMLVVWSALKKTYETVFGRRKPGGRYFWEQFRNSSALLIPWLLLTVLYDLLPWVPVPAWQEFLQTLWGEIAVFAIFLVALVFWFPSILIRALGCKPLPDGVDRKLIEGFSRRLGVEFKEICLWPFFEGKVLTAGVMGWARQSRYLLLTPALMEALGQSELEAVLAHEIGHVKKHHLLLYLLLFIGFGVLLQLGVEPLLYGLINSQLFFELLFGLDIDPEALLAVLTGLPMLVLALFYFRFVFGFFMRNFERQADLYAFRILGKAAPLIAVFEKIAWLSGAGRDQPNWHHFGLGERIEYLEACQAGEKKASRHEFKVYSSLVFYFLILAMAAPIAWQFGNYLSSTSRPGAKFAESFIERQVAEEPDNPLWLHLQADLLAGHKRFGEAIIAYEKSLALDADNIEVLNNLAWLLLTADQKSWRDPGRALELAERAAASGEHGHILDTLAEAYWQNDMVDLAIATEKKAMEKDPDGRDYYLGQMEKFSSGREGKSDG